MLPDGLNSTSAVLGSVTSVPPDVVSQTFPEASIAKVFFVPEALLVPATPKVLAMPEDGMNLNTLTAPVP